MKRLFLSAILLSPLVTCATMSHAQNTQTSAQKIERILSVAEHRDELTKLKTGITALLADARLTDQTARKALQESQVVLTEMLDQKVGANCGKLVDFAKWLHAQGEEQLALRGAVGIPNPQQQFVLDNPLAGEEVYLTSLLKGLLRTYLEIDREAAGAAKMEALLQLYLTFRPALELSWRLVDDFLLYAPNWVQTRFLHLAADQKRQFLKDLVDARAERAAGPAADEEIAPLPTLQEKAAYDAAYQFVVSNTPPPQ